MIEHLAVSLYSYNVNAFERADKLFQHFNGDCAELPELVQMVDSKYWATEMPFPTAKVYLQHAMERYGQEAEWRYHANG